MVDNKSKTTTMAPERIGSHSIRASGAMMVKKQALQLGEIEKVGGWKGGSTTAHHVLACSQHDNYLSTTGIKKK
jgi:hypothetical protein